MAIKEHTITIDGQPTTVKRDTLLIEACKSLGVNIPSLCYNENVHAYGVCRICLVEIKDGKRTKIVPSCVYEVRKDGLEVTTDSERIRQNRKWIIQLLLARCEDEPVVQNLAKQYDVQLNQRLKRKQDDCILCGMCVRACHDVVGVAAIAFEGRGEKREVTTPFREENPMCIACGTCAFVCPTECISVTEQDGVRTISRWHGEKTMVVRKAKMLVCEKCGNYFLPSAIPEVYQKKMGIDPGSFCCLDCR